MDIEPIIQIVAGISTFIALLFAIQKLVQWLKPISIMPSIHYPRDDAIRGIIGAEIVNKSREAQFITRCYAIGTHPLKYIILKHLRHPFTKPSLYKTIRYGTIVFPLVQNNTVKLEPYEPVSLEHRVTDHPLAYFDASLFLIEAQLSTGRRIRSPKLEVPRMWHFLYNPYIKSNNA